MGPRRKLRSRNCDESDESPADSFLERRRALSRCINNLHTSQRLYMPGVIPDIDAVDPVLLADHPENVALYLPSALPSSLREAYCVNGLPRIEYRLRCAQATDSLNDIRRFRRLIRIIAAKTQSHIATTQRTRSTSLFDKAKTKLARAVSTYRASRKAISNLAPNEEFGRWKKVFLKLEDCDIRGPGCEEVKRSNSHHVESWIWTTSPQVSTSSEDPDLYAAIRVEWCKTQERAKRYEEEVELVVEEMRRTLATFEWNVCEWERRATSPLSNPAVDNTVAAGITSYAYKQADIHRKMISVFINCWYKVLKDRSLGSLWLDKFPPPPEVKRRRLISNVRLYHSDPLISGANVAELPLDNATGCGHDRVPQEQ